MLKRILFLSLCLAFSFGLETARGADLTPLLDKITNRLNSHSDSNWSCKITNKVYEMDKQWEPEKTIVTTAFVTEIDGVISGELLKAAQTENGITEDITQKLAEQTKEQIENANKQRAERKQETSDDSSDAFLPFSENKIGQFVFNRLDDTTIDGRGVFVIEARAKEKDEQLYDGKFFRRRSRTRVYGSMLFKRFRVVVEEEYSDVKVLD